ncbi:MAG TPA: TIGR04086 family membrane protein [Syntrophomonadaceae bacterium]|nr:TIGR04086 family membrane protein [Syntrophomonadaceae bacterium]HQD90319.1 TIGR04086 family membrane protein [Syntrophomonadaceae bacterium]
MSGKASVELKVIGKALVWSVFLCVVIAIVVYFTGIKETLLPTLGKMIIILTVFGAGCSVSRHYGSKGLVRGMTMGIAFFILMVIATIGFQPELISFKSFLSMLAITLTAGGLGGILGIGLSEG